MAPITLRVSKETAFGDYVAVVGGPASLGAWDTKKSLALTTTAETYPIWTATVEIPDGETFEYKYGLKKTNDDGSFTWESVENRKGVSKTATIIEEFNKIGSKIEEIAGKIEEVIAEKLKIAEPAKPVEEPKAETPKPPAAAPVAAAPTKAAPAPVAAAPVAVEPKAETKPVETKPAETIAATPEPVEIKAAEPEEIAPTKGGKGAKKNNSKRASADA
eukprot:CAMPEP_0184655700 /NCGR_PEP_ID=MMETSP0308-20130426/14351_1 /TAXON_ID=38269 /ORGANISM="Gloeochaete witrockiana, Strain SAG 46.84" /LENGTH=217 /DNA_ID=CAMNT_0027092391 /DNA_START=140 /DNA_END=793 /DNA_ORIENTATION=-